MSFAFKEAGARFPLTSFWNISLEVSSDLADQLIDRPTTSNRNKLALNDIGCRRENLFQTRFSLFEIQ